MSSQPPLKVGYSLMCAIDKDLRERIRSAGIALGFSQVRFTGAESLPHLEAYQNWLVSGMNGGMSYLSSQYQKRFQPSQLLPEAQTCIVVSWRYPILGSEPKGSPPKGYGLIARHATAPDYHPTIRALLELYVRQIFAFYGQSFPYAICVDSASLLEKELAVKAGLGFMGKNTLVISPGSGSFFLIGVLLISQKIKPDIPLQDACGGCEACLNACPTVHRISHLRNERENPGQSPREVSTLDIRM